MNATQQNRNTKPARETHGECRLDPACSLSLADAIDAGEAMLVLWPEHGESSSYTVQRLHDNGITLGFRLMKLTHYIIDRKVYDIDVTQPHGWQCDCPDAQYRNRECKHIRALRAALAAKGITVAAPVQPASKPIELEDL